MSWSGFVKNPPDPRKKCTLCNETGHLASECPNQTGPAPAPAPAPAPPPPPARSYASAAARPITQDPAAAERFNRLVGYPRDPKAAKPNPAAAPKPAAAPSVSSATQPVTTAVPSRPAVAPTVPSTAQPIPVAAVSRPAAASSRPTPTWASPSAGPPILPTTAPSSAAQGAGSFNVDLASIGIELSQEQKSWDPTRQKHDFGIRIGYGTVGKRLSKPEVLTNYVKISKRPPMVGVYELKIVRHTDHDGKEFLVKDKTEKKAIFEQLKHQPGYQNLSSHRNYATDHDLIWATGPLFPVEGDKQAVLPATQIFTVNHPHTNHLITFESVSITWKTQIDSSQSPLAMLQSSNASIDASDDGAILIRGINAFVTQHARENMSTQQYASTAANRFFLTQHPHEKHLDRQNRHTLRAFRGFSVSTRPGVDDLYLNIHVGASPFLEDITVQQLLRNFRATDIVSPREAFNIFKEKEAISTESKQPGNVIITSIGSTVIRDGLQNNNTWSSFDNHLRATLGLRDLQSSLDFRVNVRSAVPTNPILASKLKLSGFHAFRGLLSPDQTSAMLDFACKLLVYNKEYLQGNGFSMLGLNTDAGQQRVAAFGMEVESSLLKVPARWLQPPLLRYNRNAEPKFFKEASWNLKDREFFKPSKALKEVLVLGLH